MYLLPGRMRCCYATGYDYYSCKRSALKIVKSATMKENTELIGEIYDLIKDIRDPEKPQTLEELEVVNESDITVQNFADCDYVNISLTPTVPHCSLATIIGLCVRVKLEKYFEKKFKLDIILKEGTHSSSDEVSKQLNDKERVAAAMENPNLRQIVETCIKEEE